MILSVRPVARLHHYQGSAFVTILEDQRWTAYARSGATDCERQSCFQTLFKDALGTILNWSTGVPRITAIEIVRHSRSACANRGNVTIAEGRDPGINALPLAQL